MPRNWGLTYIIATSKDAPQSIGTSRYQARAAGLDLQDLTKTTRQLPKCRAAYVHICDFQAQCNHVGKSCLCIDSPLADDAQYGTWLHNMSIRSINVKFVPELSRIMGFPHLCEGQVIREPRCAVRTVKFDAENHQFSVGDGRGSRGPAARTHIYNQRVLVRPALSLNPRSGEKQRKITP